MRTIKIEKKRITACTKQELVWVIETVSKQLGCGLLVDYALYQLEVKRIKNDHKKAMAAIDESKRNWERTAEILRPYEGCKISEIPLEVLEEAADAEKAAVAADKKCEKLLGIRRKQHGK